jgi:D-glycero-alpha-D-manno-heptose-7-phosphate kinase
MSVVFARSPLRVTLAGGGTDLPSWYGSNGGFVLAAAIDRHVFMLLNTEHQDRYRLKHIDWEEAESPADVQHPILREVLAGHWDGGPFELASTADVPPGTGLGSSGAYTVCALGTLALAAGRPADRRDLAEEACTIEIDHLGRTVGKQDQYASAYGGIRAYELGTDGRMRVESLALRESVVADLEEQLLLFYTGAQRSASDLLATEAAASAAGDDGVERSLSRAMELAHAARDALESGDLDAFGALMNEQWEAKRARSPAMATARMDELRELALSAGGTGVMQMGAGGGGYLMVHAHDPAPVRDALASTDAPELRFRFDREGFTGARYGDH